METYNELVNKVAQACLEGFFQKSKSKGLKTLNAQNAPALLKRQHKRGADITKSIDAEKDSPETIQHKLQKSVQEFKTREYADKHGIPLNCSIQEKAQRIKECVGMIMDVAPIMPVGQENPAKKEKDKKKKSAK